MVRAVWLLAVVAVAGCSQPSVRSYSPKSVKETARLRSQNAVFQGAFHQLAEPAAYDPTYYAISYPNGDVPKDRGACADVVVRALRSAGQDLQRLIHEDAKSGVYPRIVSRDTNIDHRRVLNQEVFLSRHGQVLTKVVAPQTLDEWRPGDIVSWRLPAGQTHIGVVSDTKRPDGAPYVIHNISRVAEEDVLTRWTIAGHFRFP